MIGIICILNDSSGDPKQDIGQNPGFSWNFDFSAGFWGPGGVPAARSRNSGPDGLRESPR